MTPNLGFTLTQLAREYYSYASCYPSLSAADSAVVEHTQHVVTAFGVCVKYCHVTAPVKMVDNLPTETTGNVWLKHAVSVAPFDRG